MAVVLVRRVVPALLALAGVVLLIVGGDSGRGAGVVLLGSALMVVCLNLLLRIGMASTADREREQRAREYFDRHGRWPDDE